jgi:predicted XRE-type DNA-binding protein
MDELLHQVNGAIARLQVNQITSLSSGANTAPVLSFELPLRVEGRIDVIQISIFQDQRSHSDENHSRWSASLSIDLEQLGIIYATVTISQEQVWTSFWAEQPSTVDVINQHLQELSSQKITHGVHR